MARPLGTLLQGRKITPFSQDGSNYFLIWMVTIMVFLATLCIAMGLSFEKLLNRWESSISGSITIQVLPSAAEMENRKLFMENIAGLMSSVSKTPGVKSARLLGHAELAKLLDPWFGSGGLINELPMPQVIDVELDESVSLDFDVLKSVLALQTSNASIDIHRAWLKKLSRLITSMKMLAYGILLIIISSTVVLVIYATTTAVSLHKPVIDLLHLIGARDAYIAMQISRNVFTFSLNGACYGFLMTLPVILLVGYYLGGLDRGLSELVALRLPDWLLLVACALFTCVISGVSAYVTVMGKLKKRL